ncbi:glycoside hydrolase family 31 protein [Pseudomonas sp. PCH446]
MLRDMGSVWQYYELINTQWPTDPAAPPTTPGPGTLPGSIDNKSGGKPTPVYLANSIMETYFQQGNQPVGQEEEGGPAVTDHVFATESCMGCHYSAGIASAYTLGANGVKTATFNGPTSADFSWTFQQLAHFRTDGTEAKPSPERLEHPTGAPVKGPGKRAQYPSAQPIPRRNFIMSRPLTQKAYLSANGARDFLQTDPAGTYQFVTTNNFTPNLGQWTPFGNVGAITRAGNSFLLSAQNNDVSLQLSFLSPRCFRIRFNPAANASYDTDNSYAVINRDLGPVTLNILQNTQDLLLIDTGALQLRINLQPYALQVFRDNGSGPQLVHSDTTDDNQYYNLVYLPGHEVIANFKQTPVNAYYFGFGEKAGAQLAKNGFSLTQFNFDNFEYLSDTLAQGEQSGPLNPSEPLYCSVPLLIENNPCPQGVNAGPAYSYGLFFDNPSQSYFNIGANDYSDMDGMYYFGALYGELDYYFMLGDQTSEVVDQYTQLTGRPALAPRYALGYHQGCYGYYDQEKLSAAADAYRNASIPIDGLHIDIDLQNNYRTFTSSTIKFPGLGVLFSNLKANGFKCSTNITAMISNNPLDETGEEAPYPTRDEGVAQGYFLRNVRAGLPTDGSLFVGKKTTA